MVTATFNGTVVAESDDTIVSSGYHYFPVDAVRRELLEPSQHTSACASKGQASYWSVVVGDRSSRDAAWQYLTPLAGAEQLAGRIAFWGDVEVK